jgi:hypothetical protein
LLTISHKQLGATYFWAVWIGYADDTSGTNAKYFGRYTGSADTYSRTHLHTIPCFVEIPEGKYPCIYGTRTEVTVIGVEVSA